MHCTEHSVVHKLAHIKLYSFKFTHIYADCWLQTEPAALKSWTDVKKLRAFIFLILFKDWKPFRVFIVIPLQSERALSFVSDDVVMNNYSKNVKQLCTVFLYLKPNWKTPLQRLSLYTAFTNDFRECSETAGKPPHSQRGTSNQLHPRPLYLLHKKRYRLNKRLVGVHSPSGRLREENIVLSPLTTDPPQPLNSVRSDNIHT